MPWTDAFIPAEVAYRAEVMKHTWGHLAPKENQVYYGQIQFALGIFGSDGLNPTPIKCEFTTRKHETLDSSPWFYDHMMDFLQSLQLEEGHVYRFEGTFHNYEFKGKVRRLKLVTDTEQ